MSRQPNVVFIFGDQWRAQATGYAGDPNVKTPNIDRLAAQSVNLTNAVAGCPVCSPYRASLLTGRYPHAHGIFFNDVCLSNDAASLADAFKAGGYNTAYVGKWHLDGHGRESFIPKERRQGFDYWKVLECTHDYNDSPYFDDDPEQKKWDGYDAFAQTCDAQEYIKKYDSENPFLLILSWGPPHNPYETAPEEFRKMYDPEKLILRDNVTAEAEAQARTDLAGYYAHCSALDACVGRMMDTLDECGMKENTILVFTSDHGDMIGSHGLQRKQVAYDESIRVPFLLRWPERFGSESHTCEAMMNAPHIMPTLLALAGLPVPETVEGSNLSPSLSGERVCGDDAALLSCYVPFGEYPRKAGGREYRGLRTATHTYVRDRKGPWLLFDNINDPLQENNLVGNAEAEKLVAEFDSRLSKMLEEINDDFPSPEDLIARWDYEVDDNLTVPYRKHMQR